MKHQYSVMAIAAIAASFLNPFESSAQTSTFQTFKDFGVDVAVECPCKLTDSKTIKSMTELTGETTPVAGYDCTVLINGESVRFSFTIRNHSKKYGVMPLATYNNAIEKELEKLTLSFAKGGSLVRWARLQGVYGVQTTSHFGEISTLAIFLIKDGMKYEMEVQGEGNYYNEYIEFIDSFRTR